MIETLLISMTLFAIGSNLFWAYTTHILINKLLSRDYWNYQQTKQLPKAQKNELAETLANIKIPEKSGERDIDSLDELIKGVLPLG